MSSTLRMHGSIQTTTKFHHLKTVSYLDSTVGNKIVPVPFIYNNGVLDINIQDNVTSAILNPNNFGANIKQGTTYLAKSMGGIGVVRELGNISFTTGIRRYDF